MSINRIAMVVVVAGYVLVNLLMQADFFAGRDIFAKYQQTANAVDALRVAQEAYYAKTGFLQRVIPSPLRTHVSVSRIVSASGR